jgi:3-oxoacyl-[acyl-carrier protein] reductase
MRVNSIAPATVLSERVQRILNEESRARVAEMSPLRRLDPPEYCAAATRFLACDSAAWMTGVTLDVASEPITL